MGLEVFKYATKEVYIAEEGQNVEQAICIMDVNGFRRLPVVKDKKFVGMITFRDIMREFAKGVSEDVEKGKSSFAKLFLEIPLTEIMTPEFISISIISTVDEASKIMVEQNIGCLPVFIDEKRSLGGIITERDVVSSVAELPVEEKVQDYMTKNVITVNEKTNLFDCLKLMVESNIRRMPIVNDEGTLTGLITASGILKYLNNPETIKGLKEGNYEKVLHKQVNEIMTKTLITVNSEVSVKEAAAKMHDKGIGCLLVMENSKLAGIITERDLLKVAMQSLTKK
ncbi:MAG: CBS domain-containing protein [Candidatus Hodarchaeota archaeon]